MNSMLAKSAVTSEPIYITVQEFLNKNVNCFGRVSTGLSHSIQTENELYKLVCPDY